MEKAYFFLHCCPELLIYLLCAGVCCLLFLAGNVGTRIRTSRFPHSSTCILTQHTVQVLIYSFIYLFIYSFIHLFIYSFIHLINYSFILFILSIHPYSSYHSFYELFSSLIHPIIHYFMYSFLNVYII